MRWDPVQRMFLVYPGGSPKAPSTTTTVNQLYSPEESARRAALMAEAERIYQANKGTAQSMGPPAASPETLQAQQMMKQFASSMPWTGMMGQLENAQTFGFNAAMNPTAAPGFQDVLGTSLRKVEEAYTSPTGPFASIRSNFTANNSGGSGSREGVAMGMAGRDYLNTVGDVTGRLTSDAYNKGLDVFSRTMAMAPQNIGLSTQMGMMPANIMGAIGAQNEAFDEASRNWQLNAPWASFGPYAATMGAMSGPSGTTSTATGAAPTRNPMSPIGGAMMGASLGSMVPGIGTGIGAAAGLLLGLFS